MFYNVNSNCYLTNRKGRNTILSELRTQNSELRTQNSELRTQNSELRTRIEILSLGGYIKNKTKTVVLRRAKICTPAAQRSFFV